jgi:hypothetical protein
MTPIIKAFLLLLAPAFLSFANLAFADKISKEDLLTLTGEQWKGKLTYLDYSSNTRTSIYANLFVKQSSNDPNTFYFEHEYPKEPHANSIDTVILSKDGKQVNKERVRKKEKIGNIMRIVTELDEAERAGIIFRFTYLIGSNLFSIKKEEKRLTDTAFFTRNVYEYQRK